MAGDLESKARVFAGELGDLLNNTLTDGIRFKTMLVDDYMAIGYNLTLGQLAGEALPLARGRAKALVWLHLTMFYELDHETFPMVRKSTLALYTGPEMGDDQLVVSLDYSRDQNNRYQAAHLHTHGHRDDLDAIYRGTSRATRKLRDLHLPVGGRRYRPTLEDLIEFAVHEEMVEPHSKWQVELERHRAVWFERQLKAAVRSNQSAAADELGRLGWSVKAPDEAQLGAKKRSR